MNKHPFIFAVSILVIVSAFIFRDRLSELQSLGLLGLLLINFLASATIFLPAPAIATVIAGGAFYSPLSVALFSSFGAALGEVVGFLLGFSGRKIFFKDHHMLVLILRDIFKSFGDIIIFVISFIPNPFFDIVGVLAGVSHYSLVRFFIVVFLARVIRNFLLASLGSAF